MYNSEELMIPLCEFSFKYFLLRNIRNISRGVWSSTISNFTCLITMLPLLGVMTVRRKSTLQSLFYFPYLTRTLKALMEFLPVLLQHWVKQIQT